jgi:hypothetical protein
MNCHCLPFLPMLALAGTLALRTSAEESVRVDVALDSTQVTVGTPVLIKLTFRAPVAESIDLGEDQKGAVVFLVTSPLGKTAEVSELQNQGLHAVGTFQLDASRPFEKIAILPATSFAEAGIYKVRIVIDQKNNPQFQYNPSDAVELTVSSYSPESTGLACTELALKFSNATSSAEWIQYAHALAAVRDPSALSSMVSGLGLGRGVDAILIDGIANIGTDEAAGALNMAMHRDDPEISEAARMALMRIANSASDARARESANTYLLRNK